MAAGSGPLGVNSMAVVHPDQAGKPMGIEAAGNPSLQVSPG